MNFRWKAMQKMREPDELDAPTTLAAPRGWVAVMVILVVTVAAVVWAFVGKLPVDVSAPGLLTTRGGTASVETPWAGTITQVFVQAAETVPADAPVAVLQTPDGSNHRIVTRFAGKVVGVAVTVGEVVQPGATMATVERSDAPDDQMVAMLFVPNDEAAGLRPGLQVGLSVATAPANRYGLLSGRIASVSPYPITSGQLAGLVGGAMPARGNPLLVIVSLQRDAHTASGFAWSTMDGPPFRPGTQVSVSGTIAVTSQTPINLLFGR